MPDVKLSGPEREERSRALATTLETIIELEEEKKTMVADFNTRIKELKKEAKHLARVVRTGVEWRDGQLRMFTGSEAVN